jgi:Rap1a immunity proteins
MKTLCGMAVVGVALLISAAAGAGAEVAKVLNGHQLLEMCPDALRTLEQPNANVNDFAAGYCIGLIMGILDVNVAYQHFPNQTQVLFCDPRDGTATLPQFVRIILRYLQTHPERLHLYGTVLAIEAMQEAFRCPPAPAQNAPQGGSPQQSLARAQWQCEQQWQQHMRSNIQLFEPKQRAAAMLVLEADKNRFMAVCLRG